MKRNKGRKEEWTESRKRISGTGMPEAVNENKYGKERQGGRDAEIE